jgi:VanZ family protein
MLANKRTTLIIKYWFPLFLWMGFIFYTSSIPGENIPSIFCFQDTVYHLVIYLILAYFFSRALRNTYAPVRYLEIIFFTIAFGVIYGVTDELHQAFVPNRTVSNFDVFIDAIGSFLGSLVYR